MRKCLYFGHSLFDDRTHSNLRKGYCFVHCKKVSQGCFCSSFVRSEKIPQLKLDMLDINQKVAKS